MSQVHSSLLPIKHLSRPREGIFCDLRHDFMLQSWAGGEGPLDGGEDKFIDHASVTVQF